MPIVTGMQIANHVARSKALVSVFATIGGYDPIDSAGNLQDFDFSAKLGYIGGCTSLSLPVNRGSAERRELNADNFGRIEEIIPGLVDFEGAKLNNVMTQKGTFLQKIGFDGLSAGLGEGIMLDLQSFPMAFMLALPTPNASKFPKLAVFLTQVIIKTNPMEFSVEEKDDLRIVQAIDLHIGRVRIFRAS